MVFWEGVVVYQRFGLSIKPKLCDVLTQALYAALKFYNNNHTTSFIIFILLSCIYGVTDVPDSEGLVLCSVHL